jgi:hypothetical protein
VWSGVIGAPNAATLEILRDALMEIEGEKSTQQLVGVINQFKEHDVTIAKVTF